GHAWDAAAERRHGGDVQLAGTDAVRPGPEAGPGGAREPHRVGGGGGVAAGYEVYRSSRDGERAERVFAVVRDQHGGGGGERGGGGAPGGAGDIGAARCEGGAAGDELVHAVVWADRSWRGEPERHRRSSVR